MTSLILSLVLLCPLTGQDAPPKPESSVQFAKPALFARHFSAPPRIPLVGDFNGDGYADLACIYPAKGGIVDLSLCVNGSKLRTHVSVARNLGGKTIACATGSLRGSKGSDIAILLESGEIKIIHSYLNRKMAVSEVLVRVKEVGGATLLVQDIDRNKANDILVIRPNGRWTLLLEDEGKFRVIQTQVDFEFQTVVASGHGVSFLNKENRTGNALLTGSTWKVQMSDGKVSQIVSGEFNKPGERVLLSALPEIPRPSTLHCGDVTGDGKSDLICFQPGGDILLFASYRKGDSDLDGDGLSNIEEKRLGTDPLHRDTDRDGLLDGWEAKGAYGFDFPAEGFSPVRQDVLCFIQRRSNVDGSRLRKELKRAQEYYKQLPVNNPDSKQKGVGLHFRFLGVLDVEKTKGKGWRDLGPANLPREFRGLAHYMIVSKGGGGQAARMGTMGGCGDKRLFEVFIHEFGHQLGLGHTGDSRPSWCPLYRSVMNYAYNYKKDVGYSSGRFRGVKLDENNLSERLPWSMDEIRFLEQKPYRFRLKRDGKETLVDWNRNGIFDEGKVVADINTAYSTDGGKQSTLGKTIFGPSLAVLDDRAWVISINPKGFLESRKYLGKKKWAKAVKIGKVQASADPGSIGFQNRVFAFVPGKEGVQWYAGTDGGNLTKKGVLPESSGLEVNTVLFQNRLFVLLWSATTGETTLLEWEKGVWVGKGLLPFKSRIPPGATEDTIKGELVMGIAVNQGKKKNRWQIVRLRLSEEGKFILSGRRWVRGEKGNSSGNRRCQLFFETGVNAGPDGRLHFVATGFVKGIRNRACFYDVMTIGDQDHDSGWLQKRYYNEWATTSSPVAAAWYQGDLFLAFRWHDGRGKKDDNLIVAHQGLGISSEPMGDFDDLTFVSETGLKRSILWMAAPKPK